MLLFLFCSSVMSDSLKSHGRQHARFPCPSPSPSYPAISPSVISFSYLQFFQHQTHWVFSNESALRIRWPKYWSFSFSIHPSNEHSGLISFRIDWFNLLAIQETFKSLLHHHSLKASIIFSVYMYQRILFLVRR